jgi:transposase
LELQLEDAEAAAGEDELTAERAARSAQVKPFERERPTRKPFTAHLPRDGVVIAAPLACPCCGSNKLSELGGNRPRARPGPLGFRPIYRPGPLLNNYSQ